MLSKKCFSTLSVRSSTTSTAALIFNQNLLINRFEIMIYVTVLFYNIILINIIKVRTNLELLYTNYKLF